MATELNSEPMSSTPSEPPNEPARRPQRRQRVASPVQILHRALEDKLATRDRTAKSFD